LLRTTCFFDPFWSEFFSPFLNMILQVYVRIFPSYRDTLLTHLYSYEMRCPFSPRGISSTYLLIVWLCFWFFFCFFVFFFFFFSFFVFFFFFFFFFLFFLIYLLPLPFLCPSKRFDPVWLALKLVSVTLQSVTFLHASLIRLQSPFFFFLHWPSPD